VTGSDHRQLNERIRGWSALDLMFNSSL